MSNTPECPYQGTAHAAAWRKGLEARAAGKAAEDNPYGDYPGKGFRKAWRKGWAAGTPPVTHREPQVTARAPVMRAREDAYWPESQPLPEVYVKRPALPCPRCRRVRLDDGGRAVMVTGYGREGEVAYLRCKACERPFCLPVEAPEGVR